MLLNQQLEDVNSEAEGHNETLQAAVAARREAEVERDNLAEQVTACPVRCVLSSSHTDTACDVGCQGHSWHFGFARSPSTLRGTAGGDADPVRTDRRAAANQEGRG
jgi:hypothetical protein